MTARSSVCSSTIQPRCGIGTAKLESLPSILNGELDSSFIVDMSVGVPERQLEGEVIQSGAKIVENVSNYDTKVAKRPIHFRHVTDVYDMIPGISLELNSDSWTVLLSREFISEIVLQCQDVMIGALKLLELPQRNKWETT